MKDIKPQIQETLEDNNRMKTNKTTLRHIIVKFIKSNGKGKNLRNREEKDKLLSK